MPLGKSGQLSELFGRVKAWFSRAFNRKPFSDRVAHIKPWFRSPLGRYITAVEDDCLKLLISEYHGQRILHLSLLEGSEFGSPSAFKRVVRVYPSADFDCRASEYRQFTYSEFDKLPFCSESFDVVLLQHTLEFANEPQQILKEAARVMTHGGHCAIIGFNPVSVSGVLNLIWGRVRPNSIAYRQSLLAYRIKDWLRFVDCNHLTTLNICHVLPLNQAKCVEMFSRFGRMMDGLNLPFSSVYCLVARKDTAGMTFVKPDWRRGVLPAGLAMPKTVQSMGVVAHIKGPGKLKRD